MTWVLGLYPPRWRRRYGDELRTLVRSQRPSLNMYVDLIAGAIDAWIAPQKLPLGEAPALREEGVTMIGSMMKFGCASSSGRVAPEDMRKSLVVNVGGTLFLTAVWMALHLRLRDHTIVDSFSAMAFLVPYLFSMRYTSLKGRSARTQTIFIVSMILVLSLIFGIAAWIASRI